jgi:hypothetical protein
MLMLGRPVPDENLGRVYRDFALVKEDVAIDGMSLKDAKVNLGRTANDRHVALSLDGRGRSRLRSVSRKCQDLYKKKNQVSQLAILLDDVIYSAPTLITFIDANPIANLITRVKFIKIEVSRAEKIVWKNYNKSPSEDKQGYFAYSFTQDTKRVIIPAHATANSVNNIDAKETKILKYKTIELKKGDNIKVGLYVRLAKRDCASVVDLKDSNLTESSLIKELLFEVD